MSIRMKPEAARRGLVALVGLSSLVLGAAAPAGAADEPTTGSGAGTGWEYVDETTHEPVECGTPPTGVEYASDKFVINHKSTYTSTDAGVPSPVIASYTGWAEATIVVGEVRQAPQGAAPGGCIVPGEDTAPITPAAVSITSVSIEGTAPGGGSVSCSSENSGTYTRVNSSVVFEFDVSCDITGNVVGGSVEDVVVHHVVAGNQTPCFPLACPDDPVNPDPHFGTALAGSSHMETSFTAAGTP